MISEIICIGTSFTEGDGLHINDSYNSWLKENKGINIKSMKEFSWPKQLETLSNIKTRNLGKCGSSLEYLMRTVEDILEKENCSNKMFILEYSSWGRSELWFNEFNSWIVANWGPRDGVDPKNEGYAVMMTTDYKYGKQLELDKFKIYENYLDNFFNEKEYLIQLDRNFLNLLYKLKSKNIDFKIITLEDVFWKPLENDKLFKDSTILYNLYDFLNNTKLSIENITNNEIKDGHPSIEGHIKIAKKIYEKI